MTWRECAVVVSRRRVDTASTILHAQGAAGLQEDWLPGEAPPPRQPWDTGPPPPLPDRAVLKAWFEDADEAAVDRALASALSTDPLAGQPVWSDVVEVDYEASYRSHFAPLRISDRLVICPPWDVEPGALIIEPGQGFGTGDHPTTRLALTALDERLQPGMRVLDVGSGSGILALAVERLGGSALGIDIDAASVRDAAHNRDVNGLTTPFETTPLDQTALHWDVVVANVHAEVLVTMADALMARAGTLLILGGILRDREHLVTRAFAALPLLDRREEGDWVGLVYGAA